MPKLAEALADRKGLAWIAVTAFFYVLVLVLVPFNQYHLDVFGIAVRPGAVVPVAFGILWGPAAAWGLGIGNIAGNCFGGSWSAMSIFGTTTSVPSRTRHWTSPAM
jgi:energy-coupling factor transport system substrate-specific component